MKITVIHMKSGEGKTQFLVPYYVTKGTAEDLLQRYPETYVLKK